MEEGEYRLMADVEDRHWWYEAVRRLLRRLLSEELSGSQSKPRILDAGCGTGATGGWLDERGHVIALDSSAMALKLYGENHPEATLLEGSVESIALPDASVDLVVCVTVLYHANVTNPSTAIAEFVRVLRPGGLLCLVEPGMKGMRRGHDEVTHGARRFGSNELRELVSASGLEVEKATSAFSFLVPLAWVRSKLPRANKTSDLSNNASGLFGLLGALARVETRFVARRSIPFGLSVLVLGRKPH